MELNRLLFPKPTPSYTARSLSEYLIYIPKSDELSQTGVPSKAFYNSEVRVSNEHRAPKPSFPCGILLRPNINSKENAKTHKKNKGMSLDYKNLLNKTVIPSLKKSEGSFKHQLCHTKTEIEESTDCGLSDCSLKTTERILRRMAYRKQDSIPCLFLPKETRQII